MDKGEALKIANLILDQYINLKGKEFFIMRYLKIHQMI